MRTRICDVLRIDVPILQAGMASYTSAELVAAVSNAGGLGILGTVNRTPDEIVSEVERIRLLTDKPWGLNVVIADADDAHWTAAVAARPPVLSTSWGDVGPFVGRARSVGCRLVHQVATVARALEAVEAGVDVIVAQGADGGGHAGPVGTMALVPQVVDAAQGIPVAAAGGIVDGRGLVAALALGAEGVLVGTRFLATTEAPVAHGWKEALIRSESEDAVFSRVSDLVWGVSWPDASSRVIANRLVTDWSGREGEVLAHAEEIAERIDRSREAGDCEYVPLYAGQGVGAIREIVPAAEVVRTMMEEATKTLRNICSP